MKCQKDFPAFASDNRIHLDDGTIRPSGEEGLEILEGAPDPTGFINLKRIMGGSARLIGYLSGEVDVPSGKDTGVNVIVNRLFGEHDFRGVRGTDVVYGLSFFEERRDESIELERFLFVQTDAGPGFGTYKFVFLLGGRSGIKMFFESAFMSVRTTVTDIRGLGEGGTVLFEIVRAIKMTFGAEGAFLKGTGRIGAKAGNGAAETVGAVVERTSEATGLFENEMGADFLRDGGAIPSQRPGDGFEGSGLVKHGFDSSSFFDG